MVRMVYRVQEYNQEYKNKRPSVDALEIKGGKS